MDALKPGMTTEQKLLTFVPLVVLVGVAIVAWVRIHTLERFLPPGRPQAAVAVTTLGLFTASNTTSAHCNVSEPVLVLHGTSGDQFIFYSVDGNAYNVDFIANGTVPAKAPKTTPLILSNKITVGTLYTVESGATGGYFPYKVTSGSCPGGSLPGEDIGIIVTH